MKQKTKRFISMRKLLNIGIQQQLKMRQEGINPTDAMVVVLVNQVDNHKRYATYIAEKIRKEFSYVTRRVNFLIARGILGYAKCNNKRILIVKDKKYLNKCLLLLSKK